MTAVYVLLFHDVWDIAAADDEGGPEDVSIQGVYATRELAEAAQAKSEATFPDMRRHDHFTIEEHEVVSPLSWTLVQA